MSRTPPTPEELWQAILDFAADEDIDAVMAMTDAQLNDELRASGVDPIAAGKRGVDLATLVLSGEEPSTDEIAPTSARNPFSVRPPPPTVAETIPEDDPPVPVLAFHRADDEAPGSRRVFYVAGLLLAAACTAFFLLRQPEPHDDVGPDPLGSVSPEESAPSPMLPEKTAAAALRNDAKKLFQRHDFAGCVAALNHAKDLDPQGESDPAVVKERAAATTALNQAKGAPGDNPPQ